MNQRAAVFIVILYRCLYLERPSMVLPRGTLRLTASPVGCLAAVIMVPLGLHAQSPRSITVDASVGTSGGVGGGEYRGREGVAADGLLAHAFRRAPGGALIAGLGASFQGALGSDDVCVIGSRGQCLEYFPSMSTVGVLAGWEGRRGTGRVTGTTARLLAGPAFVQMDGDDSTGQRGATAGLQARFDLATPHLGPVALVGSLRGTAVPRFRGETYGAWAAGIGVRVR
jgi:hypothetical protein